jgi:undecaprenyl-diphosphatase
LFPWILLLILPFAIYLLSVRRLKIFWAYLLVLTGTLITIHLLKIIIARPRPLHSLIFEPSYSFPSGHAASSVVVYGLLAYIAWRYLVKRLWARILVAFAAFLLIVATGFSRVYLGVHYPSDVIAGWAAGVFILFGAVGILEFVRRGRETFT